MSGGRCSLAQALELLALDFTPMEAAAETTQAINGHEHDRFPLYCNGEVVNKADRAIAKVVFNEEDGLPDIESIGSGLGWGRRAYNWELEKDAVLALKPQPRAVTDNPSRRRPGTKYKDDWPLVMAAEMIRLALRDPEMLKNVDALVRYMVGPELEGFLQKEIGWTPKDSKDVRRVIVSLLQFVR